MTARLGWLELRQQVSGRIFWIVFAVSVLMVIGGVAIDELRVGLATEGARIGAAAIARTHLVWSLFFLFAAAAFVGEAALRDQITGFAGLVRATPVSRRSYALGRSVGACGAVLLYFLSVPVAMMAGGFALGSGTGLMGNHLFALVVLALPNLVLASALFFMLTGVTRSMTGCLLGAAGLLSLYGLAGESGGAGLGIVEPFGFTALNSATHGWGLAQQDAGLPRLAGELLANRALWLSFAAVLVWSGTWLATQDRYRGNRRGRGATSSSEPAPQPPGRRAVPASSKAASSLRVL